MKYVEVVNNKVVNVILADAEFVSTLDGMYIQSDTAGIGYEYDNNLNCFIPPQPFASWIFSSADEEWLPPVNKPEGDSLYFWDEQTLTWVLGE